MAPHDRPDAPPVPAPQPVRHVDTLWWWLALALVGLAAGVAQREPGSGAPPPPPLQARDSEHDAFHAFVFGEVRAGDPQATPPEVFRAQLEQLKQAGAHAVRLQDIRAFLEKDRPLPARPVLIAFDDAGRETIDTVDPILAELGLPAVAFVNVAGIESGSIALVSRHRLERMTGSGRWEAAVSACRAPSSDFPAAEYRRQVAALRTWSEKPVHAISCLHGWDGIAGAQGRWSAALRDAALPLGFVASAPGANRRGDSPSTLRMIRAADDVEADALVRWATAYASRHGRFVDDFNGRALGRDWIADRRHARLEAGTLRLAASAGSTGVLTLTGTERWRDARIEVQLDAPASGQFWIYARRGPARSFVRLGVVDERVVLQKADADGQTRQVAVADAPAGSLRLALRVVGERAVASVNGRALMDRPVDVPADLVEGPVALVVWDAEAEASASLARVEAEPLPRWVAVLPSEPDAASFDRLRSEADRVWAVSPRLFRWRSGAGSRAATADSALEIFARHHRMAMLPAVAVDDLPEAEEWLRFREQVLRWAQEPGIAGLNLVVSRVRPDQLARVDELHRAVVEQGKELAVTVPRGSLVLATAELAWFAGADSGSESFQLASFPLRRPG